jgi:hypothetical protein
VLLTFEAEDRLRSSKIAEKYAVQFGKLELFSVEKVFGDGRARRRRTSVKAASSTNFTKSPSDHEHRNDFTHSGSVGGCAPAFDHRRARTA